MNWNTKPNTIELLIQPLNRLKLLAYVYLHQANVRHTNPVSKHFVYHINLIHSIIYSKLPKTVKPATIDAPDVLGVTSIQTNLNLHRLVNFSNTGLPTYQEVNYVHT